MLLFVALKKKRICLKYSKNRHQNMQWWEVIVAANCRKSVSTLLGPWHSVSPVILWGFEDGSLQFPLSKWWLREGLSTVTKRKDRAGSQFALRPWDSKIYVLPTCKGCVLCIWWCRWWCMWYVFQCWTSCWVLHTVGTQQYFCSVNWECVGERAPWDWGGIYLSIISEQGFVK